MVMFENNKLCVAHATDVQYARVDDLIQVRNARVDDLIRVYNLCAYGNYED